MTVLFYAQPYDISAEGFLFRTAEQYETNVKKVKNSSGDPVEEFEIQFIDGDAFDYDLARAWNVTQGNFAPFIEAAEEWEEEDKIRFILAVGECGCSFDPHDVSPDGFDVDIHRVDCMRDLAIDFVDEGLFGEIPSHLENYINYDAIARDLSMDYSEAVINGERLVFRCG